MYYFFTRIMSGIWFLAVLIVILSCTNNEKGKNSGNSDFSEKNSNTNKGSQTPVSQQGVTAITSEKQFKEIVETAGDRLLVFDLYADWCMPCKILAPVLEDIAKEYSTKASFYKINVDNVPRVASMFGVSGIPFVVFVKNQKGVHALTGVQPKDAYVRAIHQYASSETALEQDRPNGDIIEGVRVIRLNTAMTIDNIYVYRGDMVKLVIEDITFPYSIHIPEYSISQEAIVGKDMEVLFKAETVGVFPIFCNGDCPAGDGSQLGQIIVMQYKGSKESRFHELTVSQTDSLITEASPLILDVRTPKEYHQGHLENAKLIPIDQLEKRLSEIEAYKDRVVLVYCRLGNRSTVAAQILIKHGFKHVYHLRDGIVKWQRAGKKVIK